MITARHRNSLRRASSLRGAALLDRLEPRLLFSTTYAVVTLDPAGQVPPVPATVLSSTIVDLGSSDSTGAPALPETPSDTPATEVSVQLVAPNGPIQIATTATLTAIVTNEFGQPLDGQYVVLWQQPGSATSISAVVHNGFAIFNWTPLAAGPQRFAADLPPQGDFIPSVSPWLDVQVEKSAPALDLQATATNGAVQLTLAASTDLPLPYIPSGTVSIFDGQSFLGSVELGGGGTINLSVTPGRHTFTALYGGDAAFLPAEVAQSINVAAPDPGDSAARVAPAASAPVALAIADPASTVSIAPPAPTINTDLPAAVATTDSATVQLPALSNPAGSDSLLVAEQNTFGLRLPEFRQFYEFQAPTALTDAQLQLVAAVEGTPTE